MLKDSDGQMDLTASQNKNLTTQVTQYSGSVLLAEHILRQLQRKLELSRFVVGLKLLMVFICIVELSKLVNDIDVIGKQGSEKIHKYAMEKRGKCCGVKFVLEL